ncbi:MAG: YIP1 family protein [Promethearchaeota archaeon]
MSTSKQVFCHECGAKLLPNAKFCGICGSKVRIDTQHVPTPASPPTPSIDEGERGFGAIPRQSPPLPSYSEPTTISQQPPPHSMPPYYVGEPGIWEKPDQKFKRLLETIFSPVKAMQKVARGPDYGIPLLVIFLVGLLGGLTSYLYLQNNVTVNWVDKSEEQEALWDIAQYSVMLYPLIVAAFATLIATVILHGVIMFLGNTNPYERSLKQSFAVTSYAEVPSIILAIIKLPLILLYAEDEVITIEADAGQVGMSEKIAEVGSPEIFLPDSMIIVLSLATLLFLGWSMVLIYFGIKGSFIQETEKQKVFILYLIIRVVISLLLFTF